MKKDTITLLEQLQTKGLAETDNEELYYVYRLMSDDGAFEAQKNDLTGSLVQRAIDDWLKNFNPTNWTYKQHKIDTDSEGDSIERIVEQELSPEVLQVAEMLASLLSDKKGKKKASPVLEKAFIQLFE